MVHQPLFEVRTEGPNGMVQQLLLNGQNQPMSQAKWQELGSFSWMKPQTSRVDREPPWGRALMSNPAQGNEVSSLQHEVTQIQQRRSHLSGQRQWYITPLMDQKILCPPAEEVPTLGGTSTALRFFDQILCQRAEQAR